MTTGVPNPDVDALVNEACISLFAAYDQPLTAMAVPVMEEADQLLYCGVIGFTGDHARGTMMLATTHEPLGATNPATDAALREWIAELANQLLGRIKTALLGYGCPIYLSTPVVLSGRHLAPLPRQQLLPMAFRTPEGGTVCVWFELELRPGFELIAVALPPDEVMAAGDALMF